MDRTTIRYHSFYLKYVAFVKTSSTVYNNPDYTRTSNGYHTVESDNRHGRYDYIDRVSVI